MNLQLELSVWEKVWNLWIDKPKETFKPTIEELAKFMFDKGREYERGQMAGVGCGNVCQEQGAPIHT